MSEKQRPWNVMIRKPGTGQPWPSLLPLCTISRRWPIKITFMSWRLLTKADFLTRIPWNRLRFMMRLQIAGGEGRDFLRAEEEPAQAPRYTRINCFLLQV